MSYETKILDLKRTVIKFLKTCKNNRFPSQDFWNAVTRYQKKNVSAKYYGVSKMQVLLDRFKDVLIVDKEYIKLRSEVLENKLIVISDSNESDYSDTDENKMSQSRRPTNQMAKPPSVLNRHSVFRERLLSILLANNGQCTINIFLNCYALKYGSEDDVATQLQFHSDMVTVKDDIILLNPQGSHTALATNAASQRQGTSKNSSQTWGQGAATRDSSQRNKGVRTIFTDSDDESDSDTETKSIQSMNTPTSQPTGFIPFSGMTSNQGLSAHQRYGLPPQKQHGGVTPGNTFPVQVTPLLSIPTSISSYPSSSTPLGMAAYSMYGVLSQSQQTAYASPQLLVPPQLPMSLPGAQHNKMPVDNVNFSHLQLGNILTAEEVLAKAEWPVPRLKSGPLPGTKITDEVKEVIVRPISLPRGSRLTTEQVNSQIKECIDILCEAKEHVSIERVETLLLQKFRVRHFRDLNLQERNFSFMPAAKDHSLLLGKVNVYIQNFVRSRSLCTLYELQECCREFHPNKKEFEHLKLGPIQKMPMIHEFFKFPHDEYVSEITSLDLMEHLNKFLTKFNKWSQQTSVEEFMQYLVEAYHVESGFSLGIRIRSLPLAIQMLKKSQRDAAGARKKVIETLREMLEIDIQDAFRAFRASILQNSNKGNELRIHYLNLSPEVAIREIFTKFELLAPLFSANAAYFKKIQKMLKHFKQFVKNILEVTLPRQLFHLAVCMSNVELEECATEVLEVEAKQQQLKQEALHMEKQQTVKKVPPTKVTLTEKVSQYVNKCLEQGTLKLAHLQRIETRILEDFDFSSFQEMGYGTFLDFIHSEGKIKKVLEESGGTLLGSGFEHDSVYKPSHLELLEFLCQAKSAGLAQVQAADASLCEQYLVNDIRHLGHGNISRLSSAADKPGKHHSPEYNVCFEAALCGKMCHSTHIKGQVGLQGSVSKEAAMACLTACPLLEDLEEWSNWPLVFQPQHGRLKDFIKKCGGLTRIPLEGGKKIALSDFKALEVEPGKLLKVNTCTSVEKFAHALDRDDPFDAAGQLVSLIVANKGLENTPLALVTNHVKTKLISLHALSTSTFTPGGPPTAETVDLAVRFVTEILLRLPIRICVAIANQVFLEPLNQVVGSTKSKHQIKLACKLPIHRQQLEVLGCLLGLQEWASTIQEKFIFPSHCIEETLSDELLGSSDSLEDAEVVEEEDDDDDDEEDSDSEDSDIDEMLDVNEEKVEDNNIAVNKEEEDAVIEKEEESSQIDQDKINAAAGEEETEEKITEERKGDDESLLKDHILDKSATNENCDAGEKDEENITSGKESHCDVEMKVNEDDRKEIVNDDVRIEVTVEERELTHEEKCRLIVDDIRREEFGVGIKLDETGQKLMLKQQERQGRSLQRLSKDLYSKETHFVLELIQNADDNSYSDEVTPSVKFIIDITGVKVMNNEQGFEEKNIRAICDVGKSTKSKHNFGYIGQKGIGFKSVFRMTSCPEVHSNGFHIYFDVNSGPMGYILPHWKENFESDENWQTQILLPWTEDIKQQVHTHAARFNDIQPSLLLFLHRLKEIRIENKVENSEMFMSRQDFENGEVQITHSHGTDKWLVLRKLLDASNISLQAKSGVEVESTEIALAFPLKNKKLSVNAQIKTEKLPVFAFLPLRSYGFRFIVQGDFDVPSSREDVDRDSFWNQWLRSQIHVLFIEALEAFKARADWTPVEALIQYLQFIPLEGEVMGFFKPVATQILDQLKAKECMPVLTADKKTVRWKMPSKTVITQDSLVLEIVSPEVLHQYLDLNYLHPDVAAILHEPLTQALGIESVTTEHLLHIGRSLVQYWESSDHVLDIAKWLACVYRSLDDFQDNTEIMKELQKMRIIPLSCGSLVSLSDITVFMLTDSQDAQSQSAKSNKPGASSDPLLNLKKDLNLVHFDLTSTSDNEVNSQVAKLLLKLGIKQLTAHDLIYSHILPVFKSDAWKEKKKKVIISYLVYIKSELDKNPSVVDRSELSVVRVVTNHGIKSPTEDVHFPTEYGNVINLKQTFPGLDWTFVDLGYLPSHSSTQDRQSWHKFLAELGVVDFLKVTKVEQSFDKSNIHETCWSSMKDVWPDSVDGYTVTDFQCEEFHKLVNAYQNPEELIPQMVKLFEYLDARWNAEYKNYVCTQLKSGSGHILKDVIQSSFAVHLKSLSWVPAIFSSVSFDEDSKSVDIKVSQSLQHSVDLYFQDARIRRFLHHTVKYLNVEPQKNSQFSKFLEIKTDVSVETVTEFLLLWGNRSEDSPDKPRIFCTAMWHMFEIYNYLNEEMKAKECQALFHECPVIFVPIPEQNVKGREMLAGWMMRRTEVWWSDPTNLFTKYMKSLVTFNSPLSKFKILKDAYSHMEELFHSTARIQKEPSTIHYAQLLKHIATVCSLAEEGVLYDTLFLFTKIGNHLSKVSSIEGGQKTIEAMIAESNLPKVTELLSTSAVFPTKSGQWVSLSDSPMLSDSKEFEEMFGRKPAVYLLKLELHDNTGNIDPKGIDFFIHLFKEIKPLSECIKSEEITPGFQQCTKGQTYLHKIVGLVQRFLYSAFPGVYKQFKAKKSGSLKELIFSQVEQLQVRYELVNRPDIFVIREETCVITDKCFYFHEKYVDNHSEINKELAKYFSEGDEKCMRELRNFLIDADFIFENKSDESIEDVFNRHVSSNSTLPPDEEVWEVPLPIIPVPPEPEQAFMVYEHQASSSGNFIPFNAEEQENQSIKSWPPKSAVDKEEGNWIKRDPNKAPALWPPPQAAPGQRNVSKLPSNIKFENSPSEIELSTKSQTADSSVPREIVSGQGVSRQSSLSTEERHGTGHLANRQVSSDHEGKRAIRTEKGQQEGDQPKQSNSGDVSSQVHHKGDKPSWGGPASVSGRDPTPGNVATQQSSQSGEVPSRDDSNGERENAMTGERRKRKLTESSSEDHFIALKRINSQEEPTQDHQRQKDHETEVNRDGSSNQGSSREVTPSSSSTGEERKKSGKHRGMLHFTIPNWNEYNEDLLYSELAHAESLTLPQLTLQPGSQEKEIGLWGEQLVFNYLQRQKESNSNIQSVIWVNATGEMGLPFDFEIVFSTPDPEKTTSLYIEVKTTVSKDKEVFHVSSNQMEFALVQKDQYEIYRVYGAGSSTARLVRIENVSEKMRVKQIQLFMVI